MKTKRSFQFRALAVMLALLMAFSVVAVIAEPMAEAQDPVGYTPEQIDAMAVDPQTWRFAHDTRFDDVNYDDPRFDDYQSFNPFPIVDWENVRQNVEGYPQPILPPGMNLRVFRGAIILIEFADRPMISSLEKGSEMMGNPQIDTGVWGLRGEERQQALQDFWRNFLNESMPEINRGHNITGGWLEYSAGQMALDLEVYGPFMVPHFQFQYPSSGTFWSTGAAAITNFGPFDFRNQFPKASALAGTAASVAVAEGVPFVDAQGNPRFNFMFFTYAGYCQSPTWQEMGSMMFLSPYQTAGGRRVNQHVDFNWGQGMTVQPTIVETEVIADPVTRQVIPDVTGKDFTGYAHIQRLIDRVNTPGFDVTVEWHGHNLANLPLMWRNLVSTGANQATFIAARNAWEAANLADYIAAFRAEFPGTTRDNNWIRDNSVRPAFLMMYAEQMKFAQDPVNPVDPEDIVIEELSVPEEPPAYTRTDIAFIDGVPYLDGEVYMGDVDALEFAEIVVVPAEMIEFADEFLSPAVPFAAFAALTDEAPQYSQMYLDILANNNHEAIVARLTP